MAFILRGKSLALALAALVYSLGAVAQAPGAGQPTLEKIKVSGKIGGDWFIAQGSQPVGCLAGKNGGAATSGLGPNGWGGSQV